MLITRVAVANLWRKSPIGVESKVRLELGLPRKEKVRPSWASMSSHGLALDVGLHNFDFFVLTL